LVTGHRLPFRSIGRTAELQFPPRSWTIIGYPELDGAGHLQLKFVASFVLFGCIHRGIAVGLSSCDVAGGVKRANPRRFAGLQRQWREGRRGKTTFTAKDGHDRRGYHAAQ
jgi:hypothetical protein